MADFYIKTADGYHGLCEIKDIEEVIMASDEEFLAGVNGIQTIRSLKNERYFEAIIDPVDDAFVKYVDEIMKKHETYVALFWICELAKRYILEHSKGVENERA